jgi:hypothetical protein
MAVVNAALGQQEAYCAVCHQFINGLEGSYRMREAQAVEGNACILQIVAYRRRSRRRVQ